MEQVVKETIESPLMQSKWQELIKKSGETGSSGSGDKKEASGESDGGSDKEQKSTE